MGCCGKIIHGAVGLAKAALGLDQAPAETVEARRAICRSCPSALQSGGVAYKCAECGCGLRSKTSLATESCPIGKWRAFET